MPKVKGWPDFVKVKPKVERLIKRKFEEIDQPNCKEVPRPSRLPLPLGVIQNANPLEQSAFNIKGDLGIKCEEILKEVENNRNEFILSFDTDWPSVYRATLARTNNIHICYGEKACCYFEVSGLTRIPFVLLALLKHPNVKLVGHNLNNDITRFSADFKFDAQLILNNIKESPDDSRDLNLSCVHGWKFSPKSSEIVNDEENILVPALQKIVFVGKIEYCIHFAECASFSYDLLKLANESELVLGFDLEWPFSRFGSGKTALIQICPNERICYIFHVFHLAKLPESLVQLLSHKNVRLTGLNIINDLRKLGRDFGLNHIGDVIRNNMVELSTYANRQLDSSVKWSLKGLCRHQLGYDLDKGPRKSSWDRIDLTPTQLLYAATDAHVSRLCYLSLAR